MLAVAAGPDDVVAMIVGLGLFVAGAVGSLTFAASVPSTLTLQANRNGRATGPDSEQTASTPRSLFDWTSSIQLGPDAEQLMGRKTGART